MDLKVYALLNAKIKELTSGGGLTQEEVEKIVTDEVAKIVADAPEDFDTLKEMSDWISTHENSAAEMNSAIQTNANDISALNTNKVDKVAGKSLISDTEIERLANVNNYDDSGIRADIETNETNISTLKKHVTGELTDSDFQEDSTVAMTKTVPSGMSDYAAVKIIGGKTRRFVQMVYNGDFAKTDGWKVYDSTKASLSISSGVATVTYKTAGSAGFVYGIANATYPQCVAGHKYFLSAEVCPSVTRKVSFDNVGAEQFTCEAGKFTRIEARFACGADTAVGCFIKPIEGTIAVGETLKIKNAYIIDATAFYGSGKEPSSVASFNADFPNIYYPYTDGGQLWSAPVESVVSIYGKNFFPKKSVDLSYSKEIATGLHILAGNYVFSAIGSSTITINVIFKYVDGTSKMVSLGIESAKRTAVAVTLTSTVVSISTYVNGNITINDVQLEKGKSMTEYEPYHETTLLLPDSIKSLPDWGCSAGDVYNYVDFENMVYHHKVGSVDMSNMVWTKNTAGMPLYYADAPTNSKVDGGAICSKFLISKGSNPTVAGQLRVHEPTYNKTYLYTGDNSMGRPEVAEYCKGVMLNYELATEELIDISDMLHPIRCEAGGTITFTNEHNLDMPNTVVYKKEVSLS